ncbi:hypothetical protein [Alkalihalobacillus sp. 1P02AB]
METNNGRIHIKTEKEPTNATIDVKVDNGRIDVIGQSTNGDVCI